MSIILDALSRAERERRSPDIAADILAVAPIEPRRSPILIVALAAMLGFGVLAALWWLIVAGSANDVDAQAKNAQGTAASPPPTLQQPLVSAAQPNPQSESRPQSKSELKTKPSEAVTALYAKTSALDEASGAREESVVASAASPASSDEALTTAADVIAAEAVEASSAPETSRDSRLDPLEILNEVRAVEASSDLAPHPVPLLAEQSKQYRDSVPTLIYLRHDFNSRGVSTVRINGEDLREGQRTRQVLVREILPDSVVLSFRETEFRLRALNSWVNL